MKTPRPGSLGLILALTLALGACRRERHDQSEAASDPSTGQGFVVDEGCPGMVDGQCSHGEPQAEPDARPASGRQRYGAPLGASPQVALADVLSTPGLFREKKVRVTGHVSRACSRKGCWMELAVDASSHAARCRVTFEDYAFFVPTDSAGSRAHIEAFVQLTEVKQAAVRHYESEGATFPHKEPDGSAREVRLIATGVELEKI